MFGHKRIHSYRHPAGGWGALKALGEHLIEQHIPVKGATTLMRMNQPEGFDCPGCAWPDPKHTSSFEFCENGAKAVASQDTAFAPFSQNSNDEVCFGSGQAQPGQSNPCGWFMLRRPRVSFTTAIWLRRASATAFRAPQPAAAPL